MLPTLAAVQGGVSDILHVLTLEGKLIFALATNASVDLQSAEHDSCFRSTMSGSFSCI